MASRPLLFFIIAAFGCFFLKGQGFKSDSLEHLLPVLKDDTNRVRVLGQLFECNKRNDLQKAGAYAGAQLDLSRKLNYDRGEAGALSALAYVCYYQSAFARALNYYLQAYLIFERLGEVKGMIDCNNSIGKIHREEKNFPRALEYTRKSIALSEKAGLKKQEVVGYIGLGNIFGMQRDYDGAIRAMEKALELTRAIGNTEPMPIILNNLAEAHKQKGLIDKAIAYEVEALRIMDASPDFLRDKYLKKSRAGILNTLAELYYSKRELSQAMIHAKEALAQINDAGYGKEKKDIYNTLAKINAAKKNFSEAYAYHLRYSGLKDSLFNLESNKQIADIQTKYETEKKEKENAALKQKNEVQALLLKNESEKRTNQLKLGAFFVLLLCIGGYFFYQRKQLQHRAEQEKLRFRAVIEAEEHERARISRELHDGIGQMLSSARLNIAGLEDSVMEEDMPFLERSLKIIDDACMEVRNISHNLMPSALVRLGLVSAVEEVVFTVNSSGKIRIGFTSNIGQTLGHSLDITIYRIVQEVLNNMIRHSKADEILLDINRERDKLVITIKDNGVGFDTGDLKNSSGIGWKNIFSRVSMLNGTIQLDSKPKQGTVVYINLLLKNE